MVPFGKFCLSLSLLPPRFAFPLVHQAELSQVLQKRQEPLGHALGTVILTEGREI